jgi:nucleoid DNA-binding protein
MVLYCDSLLYFVYFIFSVIFINNNSNVFYGAFMRKGDLVKLLGARHPGLTAADMAYCVESILGAITESLAAGGRAEFRRFGVFYLYRSRERKSRNPKSGATVMVPSRGYVRFRSTMQPILLTAAIDGRKAVAPLSRRHEPTCMEA